MIASETKKRSSGIRIQGSEGMCPPSIEADNEEESEGEVEGMSRREPSARRASRGADGESRRSRESGRPREVRSASMTVSSAASRSERVSLSGCQNERLPEVSRRASSWLFQERIPESGRGKKRASGSEVEESGSEKEWAPGPRPT